MDVLAALFNRAETVATTRNIYQAAGEGRQTACLLTDHASTVFAVDAVKLTELDADHVLRALTY
jgi:hypothetical protein